MIKIKEIKLVTHLMEMYQMSLGGGNDLLHLTVNDAGILTIYTGQDNLPQTELLLATLSPSSREMSVGEQEIRSKIWVSHTMHDLRKNYPIRIINEIHD